MIDLDSPTQLTLLRTALEPVWFVASAEKRIYWLYMLSGVALAAAVAVFREQPIKQTLAPLLSWRVWFSRSSRVDFAWLFINHALRVFLVVPLIGGSLSLALWVNAGLYETFGRGGFLQWPPLTVTVVFTMVHFVVGDFSRFLVHYLHHKIPLLWRFHAIHHSADVLTPVTLYRIHAVEMVINSCRSLLVAGGVSGVFVYLFAGRVDLLDILGASVFNFLFNMAGANLRHSGVWIGFGWLENIFISPAQHQIHHSAARRHFDKNMGSTLALWDRLFGTHVASRGETVSAFGMTLPASMQALHRQLLGIGPSKNLNAARVDEELKIIKPPVSARQNCR